MLHLHFANRPESLEQQLLDRLAALRGQQADPLAPEPVIVAHAAMRRRLSLAMADAMGICAGLEFGYLAQWLWRQVARVVPSVAADSPFAASTLAWRVWRAFGDEAFVAAQPRLAVWLARADARGRFELAADAAALLEQYVTYRPDWLQAWAAGRRAPIAEAAFVADEAWQAALWRRIAGESAQAAAHPRQAFAAALARDGAALVARGALPPRVHLMQLPTIAPLHLQMLQQLAACIDVHCYAWNPCREYWTLLVDERRLSWLAARGRAAGHEVGNRLLASWGRQAQTQVEALLSLQDEGAGESAVFQAAAGTSLLARVQDAILELRDVGPGSLPLAEGDRSLELHVCHSLRRELEVLQDQLLARFAADPTLRPCDVIVVTPDLEAAAPLVDALFGTAPRDRRLPYTIAWRARSRASLPARALLALLDLLGSRAPASVVFGLLQEPPVARRFGLDEDALARIREAMGESGVRWGLDHAHVAALGLPASRHTLADGLERLFLGRTLPVGWHAPFAEAWPAGDAEGHEAWPLGALWHFAQRLGHWRVALLAALAPDAWARQLGLLLDDFVQADAESVDDLRELRDAMRDTVQDMQHGGVAGPVPLAALRVALQARLDGTAGGGVPGGGVTFASMSGLRGLPHRLVCAIGLNDGAFPSASRPAEFDLMAQAPRPGDRRARDDDRALMLEWLLAARDGLILSHTGFSERDNKALPPSVLVAELLDVLVPAIADDPGSAESLARARARLVVAHPLQPFALEAFRVGGDPRRASHDRELAEALRASLDRGTPPLPGAATDAYDGASGDEGAELGGIGFDDADFDAADAEDDDLVPEAQAPFFAAPLPAPGPEWRTPTLVQLMRFFRNPCRDLLRRRLRIALPRPEDELDDDEPFVPDASARHALARRLMPALLHGVEGAALEPLARAGPELPDGALAEPLLSRETAALQAFAARVREATARPCLPVHAVALPLEVDGEHWQVLASFGELRADGLVGWRYASARAGDLLDAWLQHLVLCASAPPGVEACTRWLCRDLSLHFRPCADAPRQLAALLALYRRGLCAPLHFFPRTAWAWMQRGPHAARREWQPDLHHPFPEGADAAYRLALRGVADPLDAEFETLAQAVFAPLQAHLNEEPVR